MTDAIETISLIEGMPATASPSKIITASRIRFERRRQDKIDLAMATANLVLGGFSAGSDPISAVAHLFTKDEIEEIREDREERQQMAIQQAQLAMLRMWNNGRGTDDKSKGRGRTGQRRH